MKKVLSVVLLAVMLTALCAPALAATTKLPKGVNPQQMGHPAYLAWLYGERRAKQIIKDYGTPQTAPSTSSSGLLPVDDNDKRNGSVSNPYIIGATPASKYFIGCYVTTLNMLYKVYAITPQTSGLTLLSVYLCDSNGVADTSKSFSIYA